MDAAWNDRLNGGNLNPEEQLRQWAQQGFFPFAQAPQLILRALDGRIAPFSTCELAYDLKANGRNREVWLEINDRRIRRVADGEGVFRIPVELDAVRVAVRCGSKYALQILEPTIPRPLIRVEGIPRSQVFAFETIEAFSYIVDAEASRITVVLEKDNLREVVLERDIDSDHRIELPILPDWIDGRLSFVIEAKAAYASITDRARSNWSRTIDVKAPPIRVTFTTTSCYIDYPTTIAWDISGAKRSYLPIKQDWYLVPPSSSVIVTLRDIDPLDVKLYAAGYDGSVQTKVIKLEVNTAGIYDEGAGEDAARIFSDNDALNDIYGEYDK